MLLSPFRRHLEFALLCQNCSSSANIFERTVWMSVFLWSNSAGRGPSSSRLSRSKSSSCSSFFSFLQCPLIFCDHPFKYFFTLLILIFQISVMLFPLTGFSHIFFYFWVKIRMVDPAGFKTEGESFLSHRSIVSA